jgi:hypothetical protein|tara:strand:- start:4055 stop:4594 length:540 start_codon:yes stop_codon:yes gene_type:complete
MHLLKHSYNDLGPFNKHEQKLYKKGDNWYKEVHEGFFDDFDIQALRTYIELYDFVDPPIMLEYENGIFKYEMKDLSKSHKQLIDIPYKQQIKILGRLLSEVMLSFLEFSETIGKVGKSTPANPTGEKVFCHRDLAFHNIYINGDDIKLLDIDSFMWTDRADFKSYYQYTLLRLAQHFDH